MTKFLLGVAVGAAVATVVWSHAVGDAVRAGRLTLPEDEPARAFDWSRVPSGVYYPWQHATETNPEGGIGPFTWGGTS